MRRRRLQVTGIVQGVGFRPFIYRLAAEQGVTGFIRNQDNGVFIELQGEKASLDQFVERMVAELPPLAQIERCTVDSLPVVEGEKVFSIASSESKQARLVSLAADGYVCPECLRELWDPSDRRYQYPFINCTNCGPRYTITKDLPYDRERTTMACFTMCADCAREFTDPSNRRYHAQPVACPACGPRVWLALKGEEIVPQPASNNANPAEAVYAACDVLARGKVVAIKGLGGFLLAVDAYNREAIQRLRLLKQRPRKPLAIMVRDLDAARRLVKLDAECERLLKSPAVPIVLAPAKTDSGLDADVAPGLRDLGVMLPSTPLHHLLFRDRFDALIMTSGNASSEPMIIENRSALRDLNADAYLLHNRDIQVAADDSVIRHRPSGPMFVRRARGYVPNVQDASFLPNRSVLALGAQLKVTLATLCRGRLIVGRHLGDLDNARAEDAFREDVDRMLRFGRVEPEAAAVDLHPDLVSTRLGERMADRIALVRVQHHHAHMCAVMVEHGYTPDTEAVGIVLDGMGYGADGTIWGGEVIQGGYRSFTRVGHLRCIPQPGGDKAAVEPVRMSTSLLRDAGFDNPAIVGYSETIAQLCSIPSISPFTSSAGRLFDAVAAILGVAPSSQSYEGEAASLLEAVADPNCRDGYPLPISGDVLDTRALTVALLEDPSDTAIRAARFHNGLADGLARMALAIGGKLAVLSGGCMVNRLLLNRLVETLQAGGMVVELPKKLPAGDGGISAGQAAIAACRIESRVSDE
ncbi:MAG: carbamoyltransferase HypF [Deltaproteobacteria bacterium]|nr:carbamoyltransferase HypF [Deltaproteobacteria bacterium]